jgi:hypothetical protein
VSGRIKIGDLDSVKMALAMRILDLIVGKPALKPGLNHGRLVFRAVILFRSSM